MSKVHIVIDAMGGDNAPYAVVYGALRAIRSDRDLQITLTGPENLVLPLVDRARKQFGLSSQQFSRLNFVHVSDYIKMDENPTTALKTKRENSLVTGLRLVKEGADAFVYAGNTGALLEASVLTLGRLPRVKRPALLSIWPVTEKGLIFLDSGANSEVKPEYINQFALLGAVFYQVLHRTSQNPKVGLLNIGTEDIKGTSVYQDAYKLLKSNNFIKFIGNVEPEQMFRGEVDIVVCDGFTGNLVLKTAEATAKYSLKVLKRAIKGSLLGILAGLLIGGSLREFRKRIDYSLLGGAILIGLTKICIKTHGKADPIAIENAIKFAVKLKRRNIQERLELTLKEFAEKELRTCNTDLAKDVGEDLVSEQV